MNDNKEIQKEETEVLPDEEIKEERAKDEELPSSQQFVDELVRVKYRLRYRKLLKNTFFSLLVVAAVSVLIATLFLPVLEIYGNSMNPALENGDIVVSVKTGELKQGDICCLYYNNQILVKRVIGVAGDIIVIDSDGNVYVNGELLDEPYLIEKAAGESDIEYPYTVPQQSLFVLGDNRATSVDSRNSLIGCVDVDEIVGKIVFRVWPLSSFGTVE